MHPCGPALPPPLFHTFLGHWLNACLCPAQLEWAVVPGEQKPVPQALWAVANPAPPVRQVLSWRNVTVTCFEGTRLGFVRSWEKGPLEEGAGGSVA